MELFELWFPQKDNIGIDQKSGIYESVMKKLKEDGLMESYQILDIEYRKFKSRNDGGLDWYIGDTFQDMWWNYGYSKQRILLWSIGLWMLFSLINLSLYSRLSEEVYGISFLESLRNVNISGSKKIAVHVLQVIVYTAIIFFGLKMDIEKFKPASVRTHIFLFIYLLVIFVSGLICLLCIVNYIFKG